MKAKLSLAMSLAVILTVALTSFAQAEHLAARVVFTTDLDPDCLVTVVVFDYTAPGHPPQPGQTVTGLTPFPLETEPGTSVTFGYEGFVVC